MMGGEMSNHETHCYDLVADCRLRAATDLFAHTWDPVALAALRTGPRRRRELRAAIGGIRDKVLTETLHRLLANDLVNRRGPTSRRIQPDQPGREPGRRPNEGAWALDTRAR